MSSLSKMLEVLRLITPSSPTVDAARVCAVLDCGPSTAYRYIRELTEAGLLVRLPGGYALGARIIQLDLQMRQTDPLLHHGRELLEALAAETGLSALLSELYDDTVITLHEEAGSGMAALQFGRGRAMPLHRGATGRIILAHLQPRSMRRVFDRLQAADSALPEWRQLSKEMLALRKKGYCVTRGEMEVGRVGLSAPIFDENQRVLGSISVVGDVRQFEMFNEEFLASRVIEAAAALTECISRPTKAAAADPAPVERAKPSPARRKRS
jgi:DNA-binding IclR family transcriptional regulator